MNEGDEMTILTLEEFRAQIKAELRSLESDIDDDTTGDEMNIGQLQVWWIPQVPMTQEFVVDVDSVAEGAKLLDVLAKYDSFQYKNNLKPDYCNMGGLRRWCTDSDGEGTPGWEDVDDEEISEMEGMR